MTWPSFKLNPVAVTLKKIYPQILMQFLLSTFIIGISASELLSETFDSLSFDSGEYDKVSDFNDFAKNQSNNEKKETHSLSLDTNNVKAGDESEDSKLMKEEHPCISTEDYSLETYYCAAEKKFKFKVSKKGNEAEEFEYVIGSKIRKTDSDTRENWKFFDYFTNFFRNHNSSS